MRSQKAHRTTCQNPLFKIFDLVAYAQPSLFKSSILTSLTSRILKAKKKAPFRLCAAIIPCIIPCKGHAHTALPFLYAPFGLLKILQERKAPFGLCAAKRRILLTQPPMRNKCATRDNGCAQETKSIRTIKAQQIGDLKSIGNLTQMLILKLSRIWFPL